MPITAELFGFRVPRPRWCLFAGLALAGMASTGCQRQEEIRQYTVAKEPVPDLALFAEPAPVTGEKSRTIGAIVPHGETTWYFKLRGPDKPVQDQMEEFLALVRSVTFADSPDAKPEWTLPEGWTREPGNELRYATLKTGGESPMEVTVIPLPGDATSEEYLLANVNRWRKELGLPAIGRKDLFRPGTPADEVVKLDVAGKQVVLVNIAGVIQPGGMGRPPFAGGPFSGGAGGPSESSASRSTSAESSTSAPLTYTTPEGWDVGKSGGMRKAAFTVSDGKQKAEITVIDLPAAGQGGDVLANVNRWRGQIKLDPIEKEELDKLATAVDVGGTDGQFVELIGPEGAGGSQAILAVMAVRNGKAWFIKLQGDAALARREKPKFDAFVKSLKFR